MCISTGNFDSIFFLGITSYLNLEIWPKWKILLKQFVSSTPLKLLNRIYWNFVVMKDTMCRCAYPQEILIPFFSSELRSFWTSKFDENERYYLTQFVSTTPLKQLNKISRNVVVMKDIMCRCAYPQDILIQFFFWEQCLFWTSKFDENERYYWNSWSAQLHWNRSTEFPETL